MKPARSGRGRTRIRRRRATQSARGPWGGVWRRTNNRGQVCSSASAITSLEVLPGGEIALGRYDSATHLPTMRHEDPGRWGLRDARSRVEIMFSPDSIFVHCLQGGGSSRPPRCSQGCARRATPAAGHRLRSRGRQTGYRYGSIVMGRPSSDEIESAPGDAELKGELESLPVATPGARQGSPGRRESLTRPWCPGRRPALLPVR